MNFSQLFFSFFERGKRFQAHYLFKSLKDFNLLQSAESGQIPCIADSKCFPAAEQVAGNGFAMICDWHSEFRLVDRSGDTNLKKFDAESDKKWKVCALYNIKSQIKCFALSQLLFLGISRFHQKS